MAISALTGEAHTYRVEIATLPRNDGVGEMELKRAQRPAEKRGPRVKALRGEGFFRLVFLVLF